jgi:hypothetical protein
MVSLQKGQKNLNLRLKLALAEQTNSEKVASKIPASSHVLVSILYLFIHCFAHNRPKFVSALGHKNLVHILPSRILTLPSHLRLYLTRCLLHVTIQNPYRHLFSPIRYTCVTHLILFNVTTLMILGEENKSYSSTLCIFLQPPAPPLSRGKQLPQQPILEPSVYLLPSISQSKLHIHMKQPAKLQCHVF